MGFKLSENELNRKENRKEGKGSIDETLGLIANWIIIIAISSKDFWGGPWCSKIMLLPMVASEWYYEVKCIVNLHAPQTEWEIL